jgi:hypothetical protein
MQSGRISLAFVKPAIPVVDGVAVIRRPGSVQGLGEQPVVGVVGVRDRDLLGLGAATESDVVRSARVQHWSLPATAFTQATCPESDTA